MCEKSSVEEIRRRFDGDVERFSNLETGQGAAVDAALVLDTIADAAAATTPHARYALDVGCGAGNYSLKLLGVLPQLNIDLLDLSRPMLDRAVERTSAVGAGEVRAFQADIREAALETERYDLIVAAATLHHLRGDAEWEAVFSKLYAALTPGGCLWISDLVEHSIEAVHTVMWARYGTYLTELQDREYRDHVFSYIADEDSPRPLMYQLDLLRSVGFRSVDVLHKNSVFAAFGAIK